MSENRKKQKYTPMKKSGKKRTILIGLVFMAFLFALVIRIGFIQIVQGEDLQKKAAEQQTRDSIISSKRGAILDRNGKQLAVSASVETVTVSPKEIAKNEKKVSPEKIAKGLSDILELDFDETLKKITRNSYYEIIKRKIDKNKADEVRKFIEDNKVVGIRLDQDTKRFYPYGSFASHVIGTTGTDNQGLSGIEMIYDKYLKGSPGRVVSAKTADGKDMPFKYEKMIDPKDGLNVVLTIDESIQRFAEKHLETAVLENKLGNGAACIVMECKTGNILAMTTKPDFDLNNAFTIQNPEAAEKLASLTGKEKTDYYNEQLQKMWRNKAVSDTYEPGSTFKIFTMAMALEENVCKLNDTFYCGGSRKVGDRNIRCWKAGGHGQETFVQAAQNSCNPAFIDIGLRIGAQKFYDYFQAFGFMRKTGIDLEGEALALFHDKSNFHEIQLATSAFGQSFNVTPLQMITGVCAVANGGNLMQPKLVKQLTDKDGNVVTSYEDKVVRQIISESTCTTLRGILQSVVEKGGGSNAYIKGYRVAGKTGTAEKVPRGNGKYVASFIGFAPADNPQIAVLVMLDEPNGGAYYGGVIAAPVARNIFEDTLNYLNVEAAYTNDELLTLETTVPNVTGKTKEEAIAELDASGLKYKIDGSGESIVNQMPKGGIKVNRSSVVMLYTQQERTSSTVSVPYVLNCTPNQASQILSQANLNINIVGANSNQNTVAFKQEPAAGTQVETGRVITVEFHKTDIGE